MSDDNVVDLTPPVQFLGEGPVWRIDSSTDPSTKYVVAYVEDKELIVCSCPGYRYRDYCKHTDAISTLLEEMDLG